MSLVKVPPDTSCVRGSGIGSAPAGRLRGLLAGEARKRMGRSLGLGVGTRRTVHAVDHAARSSVGALHANRHASSGFRALGARCTQFCPTVHATEVRCTQFFAGPERRAASSTCAFDASRSFRGLRNCVYRTPLACSVGGNCVNRTSNCVNHAPEVCVRPQRPPHPLPCLSRQQATSPPRASRNAAQLLALRTPAPGPKRHHITFLASPTNKPRRRPAPAEPQPGTRPASAEPQPGNRPAPAEPATHANAQCVWLGHGQLRPFACHRLKPRQHPITQAAKALG